jgi:peptidoglycan/xylan/chitin deacetylase (PgdA/CDA1 family)
MKSLAKRAVMRSGVLRLAARARAGSAAILMYHSVRRDPAQSFDLLGGIVHSEAVFRGQMEVLAREFRPITLDALAESMLAERELPPRSVVVTFDDGYADNHEVAMPILNGIGVPASFYVTVDCIEHGRLPWPGRLRFPFRTTGKESWRDQTGREWPLAGGDSRERAFTKACEVCCRLTGAAQDDFVAGVERELAPGTRPEADAPMMSYEQIHDLLRHGHIVGSHSMTHPNMAYVDHEEARVELTESRRCLEARLGKPVRHFSYPCPALSPHWNEFTSEASRIAGYETAVTTDRGLVRSRDEILRLRRVRPSKIVDGLRWNMECAFAGRAV